MSASITKLGCRVEALEKREAERGWVLHWKQSGKPTQQTEHHLVVLATGVYSTPYIPTLPGGELFTG